MNSDGLKWFTLHDQDQGEIKILTPTPKRGDAWGVMACLRGTPWGDLIKSVTGEAMSHALHGWATPLMREIGLAPEYLLRKVPFEVRKCALYDQGCLMASKQCVPSTRTPDCYEAPHADLEVQRIASLVINAWRDGHYVLVVQGVERTH